MYPSTDSNEKDPTNEQSTHLGRQRESQSTHFYIRLPGVFCDYDVNNIENASKTHVLLPITWTHAHIIPKENVSFKIK